MYTSSNSGEKCAHFTTRAQKPRKRVEETSELNTLPADGEQKKDSLTAIALLAALALACLTAVFVVRLRQRGLTKRFSKATQMMEGSSVSERSANHEVVIKVGPTKESSAS